jgi:hypothetical protein
MPVLLPLILKAIPTVLAIIEKLLAAAHDQQMISLGQAQAMDSATQKMSVTLAKARTAGAGADAAQAQHPNDDAGFDQSFMRKD